MYGITLWQPWALAVVKQYKRVENRPWKPSDSLLAKQPIFAVHAGKKYDKEGEIFLKNQGITFKGNEIVHGAIIGVFQIEKIVTESDDPMFFGPYGWILKNVKRVKPIPYKGSQRLFHLSSRVEDQIREQVGLSQLRLKQTSFFFAR